MQNVFFVLFFLCFGPVKSISDTLKGWLTMAIKTACVYAVQFQFSLSIAYNCSHRFNFVKCADINTGQTDTAQEIMQRSKHFVRNCVHNSNAVVRLCTRLW